jgi:prefoldin subunit 5
MNEYEVKQKLDEAIEALDDYKKNLNESKGLWYGDIQKSLPILIEKSHVLHASGQVCPRCNGSGRL